MYMNFMELIREIKTNLAPKILDFEATITDFKRTFDAFKNMFTNVTVAGGDIYNLYENRIVEAGMIRSMVIRINEKSNGDFFTVADGVGDAEDNHIIVRESANNRIKGGDLVIDVNHAGVKFIWYENMWYPIV